MLAAGWKIGAPVARRPRLDWAKVDPISSSDLDLEPSELTNALRIHGPLWMSGDKTWTGDRYGHVVVVFGAADTGVLIHDPEPVYKGTEFWMTWTDIRKYFKLGSYPIQYLACPLGYAGQGVIPSWMKRIPA